MTDLLKARGPLPAGAGSPALLAYRDGLYCPPCTLFLLEGEMLPGDGGIPYRALARIAAARGEAFPDGDSELFPRAAPAGTDLHAGCGGTLVETGAREVAWCWDRCARCKVPAGGSCPPMNAYRDQARAMLAHMSGFRTGAGLVLAVDGTAEKVLALFGRGVAPDGFDGRFPVTRADFAEGLREGAAYAEANPGPARDAGLDRPGGGEAGQPVAFAACVHRSRWETVIRSESAADALGFPLADSTRREGGTR